MQGAAQGALAAMGPCKRLQTCIQEEAAASLRAGASGLEEVCTGMGIRQQGSGRRQHTWEEEEETLRGMTRRK